MRKFTPEELRLAPLVAEVMGLPHKATEGDWYYCTCKDIPYYPNGYGVVCLEHGDADIGSELLLDGSPSDVWLPLEHDCLEWLREREYKLEITVNPFGKFRIEVFRLGNGHWRSLFEELADTLLGALFRAIISVGNQTCGEKGA